MDSGVGTWIKMREFSGGDAASRMAIAANAEFIGSTVGPLAIDLQKRSGIEHSKIQNMPLSSSWPEHDGEVGLQAR